MKKTNRIETGSVGRLLVEKPDRVAIAWRKVASAAGIPARTMLDEVVVPFVREIGRSLQGEPGSAWSRTRAVLRLDPARGPDGLFAELAALKRCLEDVLDVLKADTRDQALVARALHDAASSCLELFTRLDRPERVREASSFGGIVVEQFASSPTVPTTTTSSAPPLH